MRKQLLLLALAIAASPVAAQVCNDRVDATTPQSRYTLHDDGTVTDRRTGLRWQRCPLGYALNDAGTALDYSDDACVPGGSVTWDWQAALQEAETLNAGAGFAGFNDWRVPNIKALLSIVERQCAAPAINSLLFPDTPAGAQFWSSTSYIYNAEADVLRMADGLNSRAFKQGAGSALYVRLVRGGG